MKKFSVTIQVGEVPNRERTFKAVVTGDGITSQPGIASTGPVAVGRAVKDWMVAREAVGEDDINTDEDTSDVDVSEETSFSLRAGQIVTSDRGYRHRGEPRKLVKKIATADDGSETWLVKYKDGTTGTENSNWLSTLPGEENE